MVSFQRKLAAGFSTRGLDLSFDLADQPYQAVLVIGGTRQLPGLWQARRQGVPIVQRLDGMNWLHRLPASRRPGRNLRLYLRSEYGNWLLAYIRSRLAEHIVYQSQFVRGWWEGRYGAVAAPASVIYNAVDLAIYSPHGTGQPPQEHARILLVEGSLAGGYELGLEHATGLAKRLAARQLPFPEPWVELAVAGKVSPEVRGRWEREFQQMESQHPLKLTWYGVVPEERIPEIDRSAHLLYAADINSACPNSVIEAMACGLPVVAFDSGALPELVSAGAGKVVAYGGDPWKLETPDLEGLATAAAEVITDRARFSRGARQRAEQAFGLDRMVEAYLNVLLPGG